MSGRKRDLSIQMLISILFSLAILVTVSSITALLLRGWFVSARATTTKILQGHGQAIVGQMTSFLHEPLRINEINRQMLSRGLLDMNNDQQRDRYFSGLLQTETSVVYSISYGSTEGAYYGVRRNEAGSLELMKNNQATGGHSWYYAVLPDGSAGEQVQDAGRFDARTRDWYLAARQAGQPVFSPVYQHFVMNDLALSAALPVYDEQQNLQGVLGTHLLLSGISAQLRQTIQSGEGYALIIEPSSGHLVASSLPLDVYQTDTDGRLVRRRISEIDHAESKMAYAAYQEKQEDTYHFRGENGRVYVHAEQVKQAGVDWVLLTVMPQKLLLAPILRHLCWTMALVILAVGLSIILYRLMLRKYLRPMRNLLQVTASISEGDLSQRASVVRQDEIGRIAQSVNTVADQLTDMINNLESRVEERTAELNQANQSLQESKNRLQLILNSTAEGIYGIDLNGRCTFSNSQCVTLLGYRNYEDLLGKTMHEQVHHSDADGRPFPMENCKIMKSIRLGLGLSADDEVYWRADGTSFPVAYYAYPQIQDEQVIGGVVSFRDITEQKKQQEEIEYLHCHDALTGLFNRRCFERHQQKLDTPEHLPLSVIFADINGLKLTNDIFGHAVGDELIKKAARILRQSCRESDLVARVGGDEFIILLPATNAAYAQDVEQRIRAGFQDPRIGPVTCSVSLGCATRHVTVQSLEDTLNDAENIMYKDKTVNRRARHKAFLEAIIERLFQKSPREKIHARMVAQLCAQTGTALGMDQATISKLEKAGYLHDIGKITLDEQLLGKDSWTERDSEAMKLHAVTGYRILNLFDETLDLAEPVYAHHERWDGQGYPRGLRGEQIPRIARVISVAETYERVLNRGQEPWEDRQQAALQVIEQGAGSQFDPQIVAVFCKLLRQA